MTDLEIVYLIREAKNKDAFNYLLNKYWNKVYGYTFKWYKLKYLAYTLGENELKTILYDCFLKAVLKCNIKLQKYTSDFFPKLWFTFCKNTILNYNRTFTAGTKGNIKFNGIEDKHVIESINPSISIYSGTIFYNLSEDLFAKYIIDLTSKFLKENNIEPKNKKWIIDKLSNGGERTIFDDSKFSEKEKIVLWRQYQITKKYLREELSKIID